jgi:hypothetical protein
VLIWAILLSAASALGSLPMKAGSLASRNLLGKPKEDINIKD